MKAAEVRELVSMWDLLDSLEIDYEMDHQGQAFIFAFDREEDTPSLHVSDQLWYDFGSGEGGDIYKFLQGYENCNFGRAHQVLQRLADGHWVSVDHRTPKAKPKKEPIDLYLRLMGETTKPKSWLLRKLDSHHRMSEREAYNWRLGEAAGGALWIPHYRGAFGEVNMIKVRDYVKDTKKTVYGSVATGLYKRPDRVPGGEDYWALLEGESDCWAAEKMMLNAGTLREVVALPSGVGKWEIEWFKGLDWDRGISVLDNDPAGERTARELQSIGLDARVVPPDYNDVRQWMLAGGNWVDLERRF